MKMTSGAEVVALAQLIEESDIVLIFTTFVILVILWVQRLKTL
jgi:hypothetical protein